MTRFAALSALLLVACSGGYTTDDASDAVAPAPTRVERASVLQPNTPSSPATTSDATTSDAPPVAPASVDAAAAPPAVAIAHADAGAVSAPPVAPPPVERADAGAPPPVERELLALGLYCASDDECASDFCRPTFHLCADRSTFPLATGLLCASDDECASEHCDPLYYDPIHDVSHNCR